MSFALPLRDDFQHSSLILGQKRRLVMFADCPVGGGRAVIMSAPVGAVGAVGAMKRGWVGSGESGEGCDRVFARARSEQLSVVGAIALHA